MTTKPTSNDGPSQDDAQRKPVDRIDADPPYHAEFAARVEQFRKLLAELIAKRLLADREKPEDAHGPTGD